MGFFSMLWRLAKAWPDPGMGLRTGSGAAVLAMFFILLFIVVGLGLTALGFVFGFDLNTVDAWLAANGGWIGMIGDIAFNLVLGLVGVGAILAAVASMFRQVGGRFAPAWGTAIAAALIGYFAWAGLFG